MAEGTRRAEDWPAVSAELSLRACRVCRNIDGNRFHTARETMFGTQRQFEYLECGRCGCLQICDAPGDPSEFYPPNYYSLTPPPSGGRLRRYLKRVRGVQTLGRASLLGRVLVALFGNAVDLESLKSLPIGRDASILDVGCGQGRLLRELHDCGFHNLVGVDPFIEQEVRHGPGCRILKQELRETRGRFDLIMMHHSFEHMAEPRTILGEIVRLLKDDGTALIRIPLAGSFAWREYGVDWVQLDAPRHLYLHVGVDRKTKLIHSVAATPANVADRHLLEQLLHGSETHVWGDAAYYGSSEKIRARAPNARDHTQRRGRGYKYLTEYERQINRARSRIRARVEHSIGVIKRVFGFAKVRYRGIAKNANRLFVTCALANLFLARRHLLRVQGG